MEISVKDIIRYLVCIVLIISKTCSSDFLDIDNKPGVDTLYKAKSVLGEPRKHKGNSWMWQHYEFGSGVRNREELRIASIEVWQDFELPNDITNWQILTLENNTYFAACKNNSLLLYQFDAIGKRTYLTAQISTHEIIKSFKILSVSNIANGSLENSVIVVLSLAGKNNVHYLKWLYLRDKNFVQFWTWGTVKPVKILEYLKNNYRDKLILFYENDVLFNATFSLVEIYDIKINLHMSKFQLCDQFLVSESSDLKVCPVRKETTMISLLGKDHIILYEHKEQSIVKCAFKQVQNITLIGLTNAVCFQSSSVNYLAASGFNSNLFRLKTHNFLNDEIMEKIFQEIGEIISIQYVPINTYRDEVLLFAQLKNSTVIAFSWNGSNFKSIFMTNDKLNKFDLSKVTVIPYYGFLIGNSLIKINTNLKQLSTSNGTEMKKMLETRSILEDLLSNQEQVVLKTNKLIEERKPNKFKRDFLNLSAIEIHDLRTEKTDNLLVALESQELNLHEMLENYENALSLIYKIDTKFNEMEHIVTNILARKNDTSRVYNEVNFVDNFEIKGKLIANNLSINNLQNGSINFLINQCTDTNANIFGTKEFLSVEFLNSKFKFESLNGISLRDLQFEESYKDYTDFKLSKVSKLKLTYNLNVSIVQSTYWDSLIRKLVLKNVKKVIPHSTKVKGQMDVAHIRLDYLNELQYPHNYVLKSDPEAADISNNKMFESITVSNLQDVKTINGIDADEFIILHADQSLEHQITFENLVIDQSLQIDGNIVGLPELDIDPDMTLLNSNIVQSNTIFTNLYISGNIYVKNSINGTDWLKLNDLILEGDDNVLVTGIKTFLQNVHIVGNLEIRTGKINKHFVQDFISLDTRQLLPNLSLISGNVEFIKVSYKELRNFEDTINFNLHEKIFSTCMSKPLIFLVPPIIDEFSSLYINENLSGLDFSSKIKWLLEKTIFENLKVKKLIAENLSVTTMNGINLYDFQAHKVSKSGYQILSGNITIENLIAKKLYSKLINGRSASDLHKIINKMILFYHNIFNGSILINSLIVTKHTTTSKVNEEDLTDILDVDFIEQFIFRTNQTIKNVVVKGLINKINITRKINDLVLDTEDFLIFEGPTKLKKLISDNLKVDLINGHSFNDVISSDVNQFLSGPVKIAGSVYVEKAFECTGKFNDIIFENISKTIYQVDTKVFKLNGEFVVNNDSILKDLNIYGYMQQKNITNFVQDLIFLNDRRISVTGKKIFYDSVNFATEIFLINNVNEINLQHFFQNALLIDDALSLNSIIFNSDILIEGDLVIQNNLRTSTIKEINIDELMENALYLNRPTNVNEMAVLHNVIFETDIVVDKWNRVAIENLFALNKAETISNILMCIDVTANKLEIQGLINSNNLMEIYENTLSLSTNQNITGALTFLNNVYIKDNFDVKIMNKIDINKITTLKYADPMNGNFVFNNLIEFKQKFNVFGNLNGKKFQQWQKSVVTTHLPTTIILGDWMLMYDSIFQNTVNGSGLINGINIAKFGESIKNETREIQCAVSKQSNALHNICQGMQRLKSDAENMLYKFKSFEYLRIFDFDETILSVHHFELRNMDYIMVNFESCSLYVFAFTNEGFVLAANISNFGYVKEFITLHYKDKIYFVTLGKLGCSKNAGNLWSFGNYQFKHVLDLGNATDIQKLDDESFAVIVNRQVQEWSIKQIYRNLFESVNSIPIRDKSLHFITNKNETLLASRDTIYSLSPEDLKFEEYENPFDTNDIFSFQAGAFQKDYILFFDEWISKDYIYLCSNDLSERKVLQAIKTCKPSNFLIMNFPESLETLLIYSENRRKIQIYEYNGINNFKYHSNIKMKVDKLFNFELGIHPYNAKSQCLALIQDRKLVILRAAMFGEKLSMNDNFVCDVE